MKLTINWQSQDLEDWQRLFYQILQSNLLQSYEYALAQRLYAQQRPLFGVIEIDGQTAGLCLAFENSLFWKAVHTLIVDRGPLWLEGYGGAAHTKAFFEELNKQFPRRFGRARRIIPEIENSPAADKIIQSAGFVKKETQPGYQTMLVDLTPDEEALRANLKQKWRNILNKAERGPLETRWDNTGAAFPEFKIAYAADKAAKNYPGPTPKFLNILAKISAQSGSMLIGQAMLKGRCIGAVLLVKHGRSATYLAGWSDEEGRSHGAHHLLLWQALPMLQESGITTLDLGGYNEHSAHGIYKFKAGLGGKELILVGQYS